MYTDTDSGAFAGLMASFGVFTFILMAIIIVMLVANWKLFTKAGKPGWAAIVPFYNEYVLSETIWGKGIYFLFMFASIIPFVGSIIVLAFAILQNLHLAKVFGKDTGFAIGLIFLSPIFLCILAFGDSKYQGPTEFPIKF